MRASWKSPGADWFRAATLILSAEFFVRPVTAGFLSIRSCRALERLAMMVLHSAGDLIMLYLGLEMMSLALLRVAASNRDTRKSTEAA